MKLKSKSNCMGVTVALGAAAGAAIGAATGHMGVWVAVGVAAGAAIGGAIGGPGHSEGSRSADPGGVKNNPSEGGQ